MKPSIFETSPVVVITGDQDWAPEWAMEYTVDFVVEQDFPYHLFRTNASPVFDRAMSESSLFSQGSHPNFLPSSTHGNSPNEVVEHLHHLFPGSRSVRCHSFVESSHIWNAMGVENLVVDSNGLTDMEPYLRPVKMWTGLYRLHVFLEDDNFFSSLSNKQELESLRSSLLLPGLKVLNFHPIHIALNTTSEDDYRDARGLMKKGERPVAGSLFGSRSLLKLILQYCSDHALRIWALEEVIDLIESEYRPSANLDSNEL